jgi:hypothetical protein
VIDLEEKGAQVERDIFMPIVMENVASSMELADGFYKVFIIGNVRLDERTSSDIPDNGGEWIFTESEMYFIPLSVPNEKKLGKLLKKDGWSGMWKPHEE